MSSFTMYLNRAQKTETGVAGQRSFGDEGTCDGLAQPRLTPCFLCRRGEKALSASNSTANKTPCERLGFVLENKRLEASGRA